MLVLPAHKIEINSARAFAEETKSTERQSGKEERRLPDPNERVDKNTNHEIRDKVVAI